MQELRYVTSEDGFLILENSAEERFKVQISDALREGSRQLITSISAQPTSPKQIQSLYRSGKTEEEISAETGEKIAFIQMFTPAVQSELDYVTERVQGTEFVFGNRMMSFADIVEMSFTDANWRSYKVGNTWFVKIAQDGTEALWRYDPKLSLLEPQNDIAKRISAGMQDARPVEIERPAVSNEYPVSVSKSAAEDVSDVPAKPGHQSKDAEVFSLLDEIRERRISSEKSKSQPVETPALPKKEPTLAPKPVAAKGRSSLPSWDEIIFGSNLDS